MATFRLRLLACVPLLLAACGGGGGGQPGASTLAYVVSECQEDANTFSARQTLHILHGDRPPVILPIVPATPNLPAALVDAGLGAPPGVGGVCAYWAGERFGLTSVQIGSFQRVGVSPDGSTVAFELNDATSRFGQLGVPSSLAPGEAGIYVVGADGNGLRRLGPPSRQASWVLERPGWPINFVINDLRFSPDSRLLTFPDLGPAPDGTDTSQIMIQDVATGKRTQITDLPVATPADDVHPGLPSAYHPYFLGDKTVAFYTDANVGGENPHGELRGATVKVDDRKSLKLLPVLALSGNVFTPTYVITGARPRAIPLYVPGEPVNHLLGLTTTLEVFLVDGDNVLQLTNFHRSDTGMEGAAIGVDNQTVFFEASADPLGDNPSENCQLFSIDRLGRNLRQLTHFQETDHSISGCFFFGLAEVETGCAIIWAGQDPWTRALLFYSSCDPLGTNPRGGQIFAMQPDGSELRQLTETRGLVIDADGTVHGELPGPYAFSYPGGIS